MTKLESLSALPKGLKLIIHNTEFEKYIQDYSHFLLNKKKYSNNTVRNYLTDLVPFFEYIRTENLPNLQSLNDDIDMGYLAQLRDRQYSVKSINRKIISHRKFIKFCISRDFTKHQSSLIALKVERSLPTVLATKAIAKFMNSIATDSSKGIRDKAMFEILYGAGLRISEMTGLDLKSIDLDNRMITVFGKGQKYRRIPLSKEAEISVRQYLNVRKILCKQQETVALFLSVKGKRISNRMVQILTKKYAMLANMDPDLHPHIFRHSFSTGLLDGGADLRVVQELLGHSDLSTTEIYTHVSQESIREVYLKTHPRSKIE